MKVLFVYEFLPHYRFDVFRELEKLHDLDVEFVSGPSCGDGSIATIPLNRLQTVHLVKNHRVGKYLWQRGLLWTLLRRRPDAVVFQGDSRYLSTWIGAIAMRLMHVRVLYWTIGWHRPERGVRRAYRLAFYRLAEELLLYGHVARRFGVAMGYPQDRMTVIYNSSSEPLANEVDDSNELAEFAAKLPPNGQTTVTAVLRLNPAKRLDILIESVHLLRHRGSDVGVLLVGEGPEREDLAALADSLNVPLYLPGPTYTVEQLKMVYSRTTVTVIPSFAGLTTLQSFKFGVPVITHGRETQQVPESEIIEPGLTGDMYEFGNVPSLALSIEKWIEFQECHSADTAVECRAALERHWSAKPQSEAIAREVRRLGGDRIGRRLRTKSSVLEGP